MPKKTIKALSRAFSKLSPISKLQAEVELLTSCSSDTVYRLRYDTMQYDYISPAVLNLLGYSVAELKKINMRSLILETRIVSNGMQIVDSYDPLEENRKRGQVQNWQADYLMRTKDGRRVWVSDVSQPWFDNKGRIIGSRGSLRDITERVTSEQKLRNEIARQDYTDKLTGLANHRTFWVRLEEEISRIRRTKDDITLMLLSISKLEEIKKKYDPKMADEVVTETAKLLRGSLREIDIVARVKEDIFAVLMPETPIDGATYAAKRVLKTITSHNFFANSPDGRTSCEISIGLACAGQDNPSDANMLFKQADSELFLAARKGGSHISVKDAADAA
jgi:diguanylate cyclase (GGDEF)-like protein/PAS domain S-box-containing protein